MLSKRGPKKPVDLGGGPAGAFLSLKKRGLGGFLLEQESLNCSGRLQGGALLATKRALGATGASSARGVKCYPAGFMGE